MRSYQYRFHPPESPMFERCVGLGWCSGCRIYSGAMVHVPRSTVLVDALASLPPERRERLLRSETRLIEFLDRRPHETVTVGGVHRRVRGTALDRP